MCAFFAVMGYGLILVIINPSDRDTIFKCDYTLGEAIYIFGKSAYITGNGKVVMQAQSAGFYKVC